MKKVITWSTAPFNERRMDANCLFYAENLIRYFNYTTPFTLKLCLAGEMRYQIGHQHNTVQPGGFFILNKGTELQCRPAMEGTKALHVFFTDELMTDVVRLYRSKENTLLDDPVVTPGPVHFFQHIYRSPQPLSQQLRAIVPFISTVRHSEDNVLPDIFYHLAETMMTLQSDVSKQMNKMKARNPATREELYRRVLKGREFMNSSWNMRLTLEEIARHSCLSPYHFHRSFTAAFGISPMKWLRQVKVDRAKSMLSAGAMSVTQVALQCGFNDVFSFSKTFKRELGVNPSGIAVS